MAENKHITVDGNEAASLAFRLSEAIAIFPITPSSPMAELCDDWASKKKSCLWGVIPEIAEMQSEGGAARRGSRRVAGRRLVNHVYRVAGPAADDREYAKDRRRALAVRDACDGAHAGDACLVNLWGSF